MRRALDLAALGCGFVSPNPMVGAVIVCDGRIIGEGYHRRFGYGHAEVNAVASVADRAVLRRSTMYVTLEPCAHYGKTPPCAQLIIDTGIPRVVIGCADPFAKVSGRGIAMLRQSGVEVTVGVLEKECRALNRVFMTAHTLHRPYVMLKWAMSSDGFTDRRRRPEEPAERFSTELTSLLVHRLRARYDAIMVGSGTVMADDPRLDVRHWSGRSPAVVVLDRMGCVSPKARVFSPGRRVVYFTAVPRSDIPAEVEQVECAPDTGVDNVLNDLYDKGLTSVMVEGGATLLRSVVNAGLWDEARVEVAPCVLGSCGTGAMAVPPGQFSVTAIDGRSIMTVRNSNSATCY